MVGVVSQPAADAERYRCTCLHCTQGLLGVVMGISVASTEGVLVIMMFGLVNTVLDFHLSERSSDPLFVFDDQAVYFWQREVQMPLFVFTLSLALCRRK